MELINIGNAFLNNYIIKTDKGLIVIDTGMKGGFEGFKVRFLKKGLKFKDIKFIFITHTHQDHVGFLRELTNETDAKIIIHKNAIESLVNGEVLNKGVHFTKCGWLLKKIMSIDKNIYKFQSVNLKERFLIFGNDKQLFKENGIEISIIELLGHTNDSIGLYFDTKLLCGDALMNNILCNKKSMIIENLDDYKNSIKKIIELNPEIIFPSHGKPCSVNKIKNYQNYTNHPIG